MQQRGQLKYSKFKKDSNKNLSNNQEDGCNQNKISKGNLFIP